MKKLLLVFALFVVVMGAPVSADAPYDFEIWRVSGELPIPTTCDQLQFESPPELVGSNDDPCVTIENSTSTPGEMEDSLIVCAPDHQTMPDETEIQYYVEGAAESYGTDSCLVGYVMQQGDELYDYVFSYCPLGLAQCETIDASGAFSNTYTKNTDDLRFTVSTRSSDTGCEETSSHTLTLCVGMLSAIDTSSLASWDIPSSPLLPIPFTLPETNVEIDIDADTMWDIGRIALTAYHVISGGSGSVWALFAIVLLLPTAGMILYNLLTRPPDI